MANVDSDYAPDTPEGMEDGEIVTDEPEYDPLMAGNVESDAASGLLSPDGTASPVASPAGSISPSPVESVDHSPPSSPPQRPASPSSSVDDGPASPVEDFDGGLSPDALNMPDEGPTSPTGSMDDPSEMFSPSPDSPVHENLHSSPPDVLNMPDEGPSSPTGSMDDPSEMFSQGAPIEQENESISAPASPTDSLRSLGLETEKHGSNHGSVDDRSPVGDISPPASPSPESPAELQNLSPAAVRSGSVTSVDHDAGEHDASVEEHRSQSGRTGRSRSGSPARTGSHVVTPARSRSGSRSPSASPAEIRSRSVSMSGSSRSGSPAGAGAGSRSPSRSRSVTPAGSRSPSIRSRSRSGSPGGRSGSPRGQSSSPRGRSGSPRGRSGSPGGRSGSPGGRSGSPGGSRSRSVSPALCRSPSRSPGRSRSPSVSSAHGINQANTAQAGTGDEDGIGHHKGDEEDASDKGSAVGELIADIFGSSDEEEEFEGFGNTEVEVSPKKDKRKAVIASDDEESVLPELSDDEDPENNQRQREDFVSDFDLMLQRKKDEMKKRRRRRRDVDIINDNDDLIEDIIRRMMEAAEEDQSLNQQKKPAFKKLQMLPLVMSQLKKSDLQNAFLDSGVLKSITAWLVPLPDKSLPHLHIRESLLRQLLEFPTVTSDTLKHSGIGKAVMYLYKHPKELRHNKEMAGKLINEWSRPIFNLTSNYKNLSREEREQRDYEQLPKKRRISLEGGATPRRDIDRELVGQDKVLRPGDPGYIYRARVPQPSYKDYVIRPKWNIEDKPKGAGKKAANKFEQHIRAYKRKSAAAKSRRPVGMSIEGRNMTL